MKITEFLFLVGSAVVANRLVDIFPFSEVVNIVVITVGFIGSCMVWKVIEKVRT